MGTLKRLQPFFFFFLFYKWCKIRETCFDKCRITHHFLICVFVLIWWIKATYKTNDKHQQPAKIIMLDRRIKSHGSFPVCESAYTFTLEDQSATRECPISPPLFHGDEFRHSSLVASVHVKVLVFVQIQMLVSYSSDTYPLSKAEVSREYREKEEKEHKCGRKKGKYLSWLKTGSKQRSFSSPLCLFCENWSIRVRSRPSLTRLGCIQFW